jgi:LPS sulfotransferase NodH
MFHIGRSGSTVLADLLNQHSKIVWDGELFHSPGLRTIKEITQRTGAGHRWCRSRFFPDAPYSYIGSQMIKAGFKSYGFETKFYHLSMNNINLADYINRLQCMGFSKFIVLKRRNYLRKVVSSLIGRQKSQFHQPIGDEPSLSQIALKVDALEIDDGIRPLIERFEEWDYYFAQLDNSLFGEEVLKLTYEEDIFYDPYAAYLKVCSFLDFPSEEVSVRYGKTNPYPLKAILLNFNEVVKTLQNTRYEWMLYELDI